MLSNEFMCKFKYCVSKSQEGSTHGSDDITWVARIENFMHAIPECEGPALVVGPGAGIECDLLLRKGFQVYAADIEPSETEHHRRMLDNGVMLSYNTPMEDMHFESDFFGVVVLHHCLEHSISPLTALCECSRVLKHNGVLALGIPPASNIAESMHLNNFSRPQICYLLAIAGFDLCNCVYFQQNYDECFIVRKVAVPMSAAGLSQLKDYFPPGMYCKHDGCEPYLVDIYDSSINHL